MDSKSYWTNLWKEKEILLIAKGGFLWIKMFLKHKSLESVKVSPYYPISLLFTYKSQLPAGGSWDFMSLNLSWAFTRLHNPSEYKTQKRKQMQEK